MDIQALKHNLPEEIARRVEKVRFSRNIRELRDGGIEVSDVRYVRNVVVNVPEDAPLTYVDPESFDFSDVYGECVISQMMMLVNDKAEAVVTPMVITKFEHQKNIRSFDEESAPPVDAQKQTTFVIMDEEVEGSHWLKNS